MKYKTEMWIILIFGIVLISFGVYYTFFNVVETTLPDWYPDIVDIRLLTLVVGIIDVIMAILLLHEEYKSKDKEEDAHNSRDNTVQ